LLTDAFSTESAMRLAEGESKNYSEDFRDNELVVIDKSNPEHNEVVAIPESVLAREKEIKHEKLPFTLRVQNYWPNSAVSDQPMNNSMPVKVSQGMGNGLHLLPLKITTAMDERNIPSAIVELFSPQGSLGTWLVHSLASSKQQFQAGGKTYEIALRFTRYYKPFSLKLLEFKHEKYAGTETPKNFESRVRLDNPKTSERREVEIYMNNPLRYNGETYYQASFDPNNDKLVNKVTILQVVRNPSWLTPYFACVLMTLGLTVQFMMHLVGFARKRRGA
jgi:ResB-like family